MGRLNGVIHGKVDEDIAAPTEDPVEAEEEDTRSQAEIDALFD